MLHYGLDDCIAVSLRELFPRFQLSGLQTHIYKRITFANVRLLTFVNSGSSICTHVAERFLFCVHCAPSNFIRLGVA